MQGKPVPTNDWWSSLVWQRYSSNPYGENLYAHPMTMHADAGGLSVGYPSTATITGDQKMYEQSHRGDLTVGVAGLAAPRVEVDGWSDWTVTPRWTDGTRALRTTIGHGSPYVYAEASGGRGQVLFAAAPEIWHNTGTVLGVTVNGHDYAVFAPDGKAWTVSGAVAQSDATFFTVALLPDRAALPLFQKYAYSFVTDTKVDWEYDASAGRMRSAYRATTVARQGTQTGTLQALYRHQWLNSNDPVTAYRYASPRGEMRLREGSSFTTDTKFNGVLPALPLAPGADKARLRSFIDAELNAPDPYRTGQYDDTYWTGKALWRLAALVPIANQIGYPEGRDRALALVRTRMEEWLTASPGETKRLFSYESTWKTLIGYPAGYGSDTELNDHHFHYGYFVLAAAVLAQHDPDWVTQSRYGGMIKLLVKDAANYDRSDERFPFLRAFDPYAGISWASGHAGFAHGNNQESSSESMMFSTAAILFGQATGDTALRDMGIYQYTTEREAIGQYWFDKDGAVFPAAFPRKTTAITWGGGGSYSIWWNGGIEEIHGINMLPITGGSLYHGAWKTDITQNLEEMRQVKGGEETKWRDVLWEFLAIADPAEALAKWEAANPDPEEGESRAHTYHWLTALNAWGTPDQSVTANVPTYAVFSKAAGKTYSAYNATAAAVTVTFSDGQTLQVPARSLAWRGPAGSGIESGSDDPGTDPVAPKLFLRSGGSLGASAAAGSDTVASAGGTNHDGTPYQPLVYTASGLTMAYTGGTTGFDLSLDSAAVGNGQQVRISYDLTGDGTWDRTETYRYFATDPVPGWEHYRETAGLRSASGALGDLNGGKVKIELWSAIGGAASTVGTGDISSLEIPFQ
jgi:endoglucanase Acf2